MNALKRRFLRQCRQRKIGIKCYIFLCLFWKTHKFSIRKRLNKILVVDYGLPGGGIMEIEHRFWV